MIGKIRYGRKIIENFPYTLVYESIIRVLLYLNKIGYRKDSFIIDLGKGLSGPLSVGYFLNITNHYSSSAIVLPAKTFTCFKKNKKHKTTPQRRSIALN